MSKLTAVSRQYDLLPRNHELVDDFFHFVSGDNFTDTSSDTGASCAMTDAAGGVVTMVTGTTDNNECYLLSTKECWLFAANKPLVYETRLQFAATATHNVCVGVMDAVGADSILDNGAGPKASYSGAVFFKVDGGTNWNVEASIGSTQTTAELTAVNSLTKTAATAGGSSYATLRIEFTPSTSAKGDLAFFIDGVLVYRIADWTYTSATEMMAFVGTKTGASVECTCLVDYIAVSQVR